MYTLYTLIILWHDTRSLPFATYGIFKLYSLGCDCHLVYLTIIRIRSNFMPKMSAKGIVTSDSRPKSLVKGGIRQGFSGIDFFGTRGVNLAESGINLTIILLSQPALHIQMNHVSTAFIQCASLLQARS